jgi:hypothetical protein
MVTISVSESGEEARVKELDLNSNVINDQDDLVEASFVGPLPVLQKVQFPGQNGREYFLKECLMFMLLPFQEMAATSDVRC